MASGRCSVNYTPASEYFLTVCDPKTKVTKKNVLDIANNMDSSFAYVINFDKFTFTAYSNANGDGRRRKEKFDFDSLPKGFAGSNPNLTVLNLGKMQYDDNGELLKIPLRPLILPS